MTVPALIPAYKPDSSLIPLVEDLLKAGVEAVIVVDDGSGPDFRAIFDAIAELKGAHVLRHLVNLGKGAALKTGMNYGALEFPHFAGMVTADADGQHRVTDILSVAKVLEENPGKLVLGARNFDGEVPFRSRFGNTLTRHILTAITGQKITDTQTGLRGIPMDFMPQLVKLSTSGYEFELDMLLICRHENRAILETPIQTVYLENNVSSHFNPVIDSMRIYFVLLRFTLASIITAVLDNAAFALVYSLWPNIIASQALGRVAATIFNYLANKKAVFQSSEKNVNALPKYLLLVLVSGLISYALLTWFVSLFAMGVLTAKITAETIVFFFNFVIQRDFIFKNKGGPNSGTENGGL